MAKVHVKVGNDCDRKVSYFVYNSDDTSESWAQSSGDLDQKIERSVELETNITNRYAVKFTPIGQLMPPLASGMIKVDQKISIHGSDNKYTTQIT